MKDGPVLFYCKDGILYPTALTGEQREMIEMTVYLVCNPLAVVFDKPQGPAVNLLEQRKNKVLQ